MLSNYKPDFEFDSAKEESTKREETFALNVFEETESYDGLIALASRIQTLLLMEPGHNPSAVDMGVGIRNFLMEAFDELTQQELLRNVQNQIAKFIPSNSIIDIDINFVDESNKRTGTLYLFFTVYDSEHPELAGKFGLSFGKDNSSFRSDAIGSKIYI